MTPERHAKIQAIFDAVIDLAVPARQKYIDENCQGDPDLLSRVQRLLKAAGEEETVRENSDSHTTFVNECPTCSRCFEGPTRTCTHDGSKLEAGFHGRLLIHGKYLIERCLGRGAMGAVYLVKHLGLEKKFALKLILAEGVIPRSHRKNFENEARALGQLKHPSIVDVTDYGVDPNSGGLPYLVMEYLDGQTLRQILKRVHILPLPQALPVFRGIASALDFAHKRNIVHGDLKPANLFVAEQPTSTEVIKVVDFGLATLLRPTSEEERIPSSANSDGDEHSQVKGQIQGTIPYMAPELWEGRPASGATDRFAFGVTMYEALTGFLPYGESIASLRENFATGPVPPSERNPQLPKELDRPILALLKPRSSDRPASASAAVEELEQAWLRAQQREWRVQESPRRFVLAALVTVLMLLIIGFSAKLHLPRVLEDRTWDARLATLPPRSPDPSLLLVMLDDATLAKDTRPLADVAWADEFGQNLSEMFAAGARGIAIDLLLPFSWSQSTEFARAIGSHADLLALSLFSSPSGNVIGAECISPLLANVLGLERYRDLFGFVNLHEDEDRTVRSGSLGFLDRSGKTHPSLPGRLASISRDKPRTASWESPVWIDYSVRLETLPKISWMDIRKRLKTEPGLFRNKLVIIGADYEGSGDENRVPAFVSTRVISGVFLQALIVNTIMAGVTVHAVGLPACLFVAGICCFAILALALRFPHRFRWSVWLGCSILVAYFLASFAILRISHSMIKVVAPSLAIFLSLMLAWILKSYLRPYPTSERLEASARGPLRLLHQKALCAAALLTFPLHAAVCCRGSVAVVASLSGQATVQSSSTGQREPLSTLDWLQPGVILEVGNESKATVILLNGHRYEIGPRASVTLTADGLANTRGPVRELPPVPPIPKAMPIADSNVGTPGAVRFRGAAAIKKMYPREGMTALANGVRLSFAAIPDASTYRVELKDSDGNPLVSLQTAGISVTIPNGTLQPGTSYSWHVRAIGSIGVVGEGEATFATLSEQDSEQRARLASALPAGNVSTLALMADVDLRLGLLEEARQGFEAALRRSPADVAIRHGLEMVQGALAEDPRH